MSQTGTKALFGQWLSSKKHMTYTRYTELPIPQKLEIQKEYRTKKVQGPVHVVEAVSSEA